ncbi:MAG: cohesin domain-containing protein [bacterium]|nr:cohesin domain-containing protein [bacterium]
MFAFIRVALAFVLFSVLPLSVAAQATLFVSPASGSYKTGELFSVLLNANTGGQAINAASAVVNFDNTRLDVASIGYAQSIFTLWTEEPKFSNAGGTIRFSGGLPFPGYTGANGAILRVTFRPKASGQAPVVFSSGSVLANDGRGTNILNDFRGGIFTIQSSSQKTPTAASGISPGAAPVVGQSVLKLLEPPILTGWPPFLISGEILQIRGLAIPNSKVLVYVQKETEEPVAEETVSGPDGRFNFVFPKTVGSKFYQVWAKTVALDGSISSPSDAIIIEVKPPWYLRIGNMALNYVTIIVTILALLAMAILVIFYTWWKVRRWQTAQGVEISEAERTLHSGFQDLQSGLRKYLRYLTETKSAEGIRRREAETEEGLSEQLKDIESGIEKEIEDISSKKKKE